MSLNKEHLKEKIENASGSFIRMSGLLAFYFLLMRIYELIFDAVKHGVMKDLLQIFLSGTIKDMAFLLTLSAYFFPAYLLIYIFSKRAAHAIFIILSVALCLLQLVLVQYFLTTLELLGGDLWGYSIHDVKQTLGAAGSINLYSIVLLSVFTFIVAYSFIKLPKVQRIPSPYWLFLPLSLFIFQIANIDSRIGEWRIDRDYANNLSTDKTYFFFKKSYEFFFPHFNDMDIYSDEYSGEYEGGNTLALMNTINYTDPVHYPFLHTDQTADVLSSFFNTSARKPNIVFLIVEGLGRAFSNKGSYLGSYTPFVDSISQKGLYWENFLSSGGRTFAALPSILGSLPFARNGFMELGNNMPPYLTLLNILKHNGYETSFYYGGDASFDNMSQFLEKSSIDKIYDEKTFPSGYSKITGDANDFSWGYGDKELFRRYFDINKTESTQPYVHILLTISTHNPFVIDHAAQYNQRFESRLNELGFSESQKNAARSYQNQYASILYADDALKQFFYQYAQKQEFQNTIFIITGDHRMPEIPMSTKIDRYHVPFIIYSPMLKRTATFSSVSTHFDITPSLIALLNSQYQITAPSLESWIGTGLDTAHTFRNIHAYPLMQSKNNLTDFIMGDKMLNGDNLFTIQNNMNLLEENSNNLLQVKGIFEKFNQKNQQILNGGKLIPDSIYLNFKK